MYVTIQRCGYVSLMQSGPRGVAAHLRDQTRKIKHYSHTAGRLPHNTAADNVVCLRAPGTELRAPSFALRNCSGNKTSYYTLCNITKETIPRKVLITYRSLSRGTFILNFNENENTERLDGLHLQWSRTNQYGSNKLR